MIFKLLFIYRYNVTIATMASKNHDAWDVIAELKQFCVDTVTGTSLAADSAVVQKSAEVLNCVATG
jgi:hypothetical protein